MRASGGGHETEAEILVALGEPLSRVTLGLPTLKAGQVLVDIAFAGVCHSQLNEARGKRGPDAYVPHTLGHEGSGIVRATGPGVTKVQAGDAVVLTWIKAEGMDPGGTVYESEGRKVNSGPISTFMRASVVAENRLVKLPAGMPMREAALLGCAVPTGAGVVMTTAALRKGETIAIFGAGGIGLSAILAAKSLGAERIIAVDVSESKLERARNVGATDLIDARDGSVLDKILELTGKRGVDCAVEAAGRTDAMETAFRAVRTGGGRCVIAGNLAHGETMSIDPLDLIKGKQLAGTWGGETQPDRDIPRYAELFLQGSFPMDKLITHEYAFGNINQALDDLENGLVGRALIAMDDPA